MPTTNTDNDAAATGAAGPMHIPGNPGPESLQHGKPQIVVHITKSLNYTAFDARWVPMSARFVVLGQFARGTGAMQIYELDKGEAKMVHQAEKSAAFKCGTFGASSLHHRHFATGDFDGRMSVWNLERTDAPVYSVKAHDGIINAIDGMGGATVGHGAPEIATGGRDGCVKIWDVRQKDRPVASITPEEGETARDCWAVSFGNSYNNDERVVCAGYDNGDVKMFDLRMMALKWETNVKNGVCSIDFDRKDIEMNKMVVATLEANFHVYDLRTLHEKHGFASLKEKAHAATTIWAVRHLPQNRDIFATCGGDGGLQLFQYHYPQQRSKPVSSEDTSLVGVPGTVSLLNKSVLAQQPLASIDWSPDKQGLAVTTSFDQSLRVVIVTGLNKLR